MEALPYENIVWSPYPPLLEFNDDDLAATSRETLEALRQASSLTDFIASRKQSTLGALYEAVNTRQLP